MFIIHDCMYKESEGKYSAIVHIKDYRSDFTKCSVSELIPGNGTSCDILIISILYQMSRMIAASQPGLGNEFEMLLIENYSVLC